MSAMSMQICIVTISRQHAYAAIGTAVSRTYSTDVRRIKNIDPAALKRGTGGRSSFSGIVATVFGNTGFLGRSVCNKLGKIGSQLILPYRSDYYDVLRLRLCGDLGQVLFHPFELRDYNSIKTSIKYSNVVINLIGRDWETKNYKFDDVHVTGARDIARACREAGVERLIHVSTLNGTEHPTPLVIKGGSKWIPSKYRSEAAVLEEFPDATIFRPSDMFGPGDRFMRYYYGVLRRQFRFVPLWANGEKTIKQPVYVSDVGLGIMNAIKDPTTKGKIYQAVGPNRYLLSELVDYFHRLMRKTDVWGYKRYDLKWDPTFLIKARITSFISPNQPMQNLHLERIEREYITDVMEPGVPTLEDLGVKLTPIEDQGDWILRQFRAFKYYDEELNEFETPAPPKTVPC